MARAEEILLTGPKTARTCSRMQCSGLGDGNRGVANMRWVIIHQHCCSHHRHDMLICQWFCVPYGVVVGLEWARVISSHGESHVVCVECESHVARIKYYLQVQKTACTCSRMQCRGLGNGDRGVANVRCGQCEVGNCLSMLLQPSHTWYAHLLIILCALWHCCGAGVGCSDQRSWWKPSCTHWMWNPCCAHRILLTGPKNSSYMLQDAMQRVGWQWQRCGQCEVWPTQGGWLFVNAAAAIAHMIHSFINDFVCPMALLRGWSGL